MQHGNRHFAKYVGQGGNGEDVVILGYRVKTNDVLVCFLSALSVTDAQQLKAIAMSDTAQKKDFLMDVVGGSILDAAHHTSGVSWQTYLIQSAQGRGARSVRRITMKELDFLDATQKAFFAGYGPSIEPEIDAQRKGRVVAQQAVLTGQPLPEPPVVVPVVAPAPTVDPALAMIAESLKALAEGQAAIAAALGAKVPKKVKVKAKTTRKPAKKAKASGKPRGRPRKTAVKPAPVSTEDAINLFAESAEA